MSTTRPVIATVPIRRSSIGVPRSSRACCITANPAATKASAMPALRSPGQRRSPTASTAAPSAVGMPSHRGGSIVREK